MKFFRELDTKISNNFSAFSQKDSIGHYFCKLFEFLCHGIPWFLLSLIMLYRNHDSIWLNFFLGLLFDIVSIAILKVIFRRQRPSFNVNDMFMTISIDNYSFPSGHSSRASFIMFYFSKFVIIKAENFVILIALIAWCHVTCLTRLLMGRHHFSDIIIGYVIGFSNYLLVCSLPEIL